MRFLRLSAAFLRKWDAVASDPFHSGHRCPFVIDPDQHMMQLRDAAGVNFVRSAHCELLRTASQHMHRSASEHLLHPKTRRSPVLSIGDN